MIIEGERTDASTGRTYEIRNPATGEVVDVVPDGGPEDLDRAVRSAARAQESWGRRSAPERREILHRAAAHVLSRVEDVAVLLTKEQGKTLLESRLEAERFGENIAWYGDLADKLHGQHVQLPPSVRAYGLVVHRPIGVVGAIVPWNFPLTLAANKIAPAIAAGNTVVLKPSPTTPLATLAAVQALIEGGLPEGVVNVVLGSGAGIAEALVAHPLVRKVAFTGSTPTGRKVMEGAAGRLKRLTLELGGSDPCIVLEDANLDEAAKAISTGRFFNCGQACLAVKRLYVQRSVLDPLLERLVARAQRLRPGNGLDAASRMGPMHSEAQRALVEAQMQDAIGGGARYAFGGGRPQGEGYQAGNFINPAILIDVPGGSRMLREEVFGPALPVVPIEDLEEGIRLANDSDFGLGSSIWTGSITSAQRAIEGLEAGYTWVNALQVAHDELPFGGTKQSGFGKEHGVDALLDCTEQKAVVQGLV